MHALHHLRLLILMNTNPTNSLSAIYENKCSVILEKCWQNYSLFHHLAPYLPSYFSPVFSCSVSFPCLSHLCHISQSISSIPSSFSPLSQSLFLSSVFFSVSPPLSISLSFFLCLFPLVSPPMSLPLSVLHAVPVFILLSLLLSFSVFSPYLPLCLYTLSFPSVFPFCLSLCLSSISPLCLYSLVLSSFTLLS